MRNRTFAIAAALGLAIASSALAHHAVNSEFAVNKTVQHRGVLTKIEMINPHAYLHFDVKQGARTVNFAVQSGAPNVLRRAGLSARDNLLIGQSYTFTVSPSRNGSPTGLMSSITLPDGKFFAFGAQGNIDQARSLAGK